MSEIWLYLMQLYLNLQHSIHFCTISHARSRFLSKVLRNVLQTCEVGHDLASVGKCGSPFDNS